MAQLRTDYKDEILDVSVNTQRKYRMINNDDGTVSFVDVTVYSQNGDVFGAAELNEIARQLLGGASKIRYNEETDEIEVMVGGNWTFWKRGGFKDFYLVDNGNNNGNFKYTGPESASPTITTGDALTLSAIYNNSGVQDGINFDSDLIDFTNYDTFVFDHKTTVGGGSTSSVTLQILDRNGNAVYTNKYISNTNASSGYATTSINDVITVDVSDYTGEFKVRLSFNIYGQGQSNTVEVSECYLK